MGRPRSATRSSITAKIILALTTKYAVPRQMKPRFLDLSIRVSKATLNVPLVLSRGTLRVSGKQNLLFPLGPVIKC